MFKFVKQTPRWLLVTLAALIVVRALLPWGVKLYINDVLDDGIEGYTGHVEDVDLSLWRGAYQLEGLELKRLENKIPVPFVAWKRADLMVAWKPLFQKGRIVGNADIDGARVNLVRGPSQGQTQTGAEGEGWQETLENIFPLQVNELTVRNSEVHYMDFHSKPKVDVELTGLNVTATNLSNIDEKKGNAFSSSVELKATLQRTGHLYANATTNILKSPVVFDSNISLTSLDLVGLNDFFKAHGNFDVKTGRLDLYSEAASREGKVKGYVKPFLTNVDVIQASERFDSGRELVSELVASSVNFWIRRYSKDQSATKIPFEGRLDGPKIATGSAVRAFFGHAFGEAQKPKIDREINPRSIK